VVEGGRVVPGLQFWILLKNPISAENRREVAAVKPFAADRSLNVGQIKRPSFSAPTRKSGFSAESKIEALAP